MNTFDKKKKIFSVMGDAISKFSFILGLQKFLEHVRSYVWSFSHSDPGNVDLDVVGGLITFWFN